MVAVTLAEIMSFEIVKMLSIMVWNDFRISHQSCSSKRGVFRPQPATLLKRGSGTGLFL